MKRTAYILCLVTCLFLQARAQQAPTMSKATHAFNRLALTEWRQTLLQLLKQDTLPPDNRMIIYCDLARQDWKFYQQYTSALQQLEAARKTGAAPYATWALQSRIARENGQYDAAIDAAMQAARTAVSLHEKANSNILYAEVVYAAAIAGHPAGKSLPRAAGMLMRTLQSSPGYTTAAPLLLNMALFQQHGPQALFAWEYFFHCTNGRKIYPYLAEPAAVLQRVLPQWNGKPLKEAQLRDVIDALAASRFYHQAATLIARLPGQRSRDKDVISYAAYLRELSDSAAVYYRNLALRKANAQQFETWVLNRSRGLLKQLQLPVKDTFTFDNFLITLQPRFGTMGFLGKTSSSSEINLSVGHIIREEVQQVNQYGYKGRLVFYQLDLMPSNGYSAWFRERGGNGGWSVSDTIVQTRPPYLEGPVKAWNMLQDSSVKAQNAQLIQNALYSDQGADSIATTAALSLKMQQDAYQQLYDQLYAQGHRDTALQFRFMQAVEDMVFQSSIYFHEGRHSIDQLHFRAAFDSAGTDVREYRAKLSEIAFSDYPGYVLGGLVDRVDASGHGKANRHVTLDAVAWLQAHNTEVKGYDPHKPALRQLYLLSAEQLRACFREADPLYQTGALPQGNVKAPAKF